MRDLQLIFVLSFIVSSLLSEGQVRNIDIEVVLSKPDSGHYFISPGLDTVEYYLVNHGTDTVYPSDGYMTRIKFDFKYFNPVIDYIGSLILPEDSLLIRQVLVLDHAYDRSPMNFCITTDIYTSDKPEIFRERDSAQLYENNKVCTKMAHKRVETGSIITQSNSEFVLYPNPSSDIVNLEFESPIYSFVLIDANGSVIEQKEDIDENKVVIDVSKYSSGFYFLRIRTSIGFVSRKVILIN
jgi:hypothetical protein